MIQFIDFCKKNRVFLEEEKYDDTLDKTVSNKKKKLV